MEISDEQFWHLLRKNAGLYARTARVITEKYNIPYSRQAVRDRALKRPDLLEDIEDENLDTAEEGLHDLMRSKAEKIKLNAVSLYLKTKGKKRGYVERQEIDYNKDIVVKFDQRLADQPDEEEEIK